MAFGYLLVACILAFGIYWATKHALKSDKSSNSNLTSTEVITTVAETETPQFVVETTIPSYTESDVDEEGPNRPIRPENPRDIERPDEVPGEQMDRSLSQPPQQLNSPALHASKAGEPLQAIDSNGGRFLVTGALMVTLYLGIKYLLNMDSEINDVPIGDVDGMGFIKIFNQTKAGPLF